MKPRSYTESFTLTTRRVIEYLLERDAEHVIHIADIKRYLHGTAGESLIAPVLVALETKGLVDCVHLAERGGLLYFREEWYASRKEKVVNGNTEESSIRVQPSVDKLGQRDDPDLA